MRTENNNIEILHNSIERQLTFSDEKVLTININNFRVKSESRLFDILVNKSLERQQYEFLRYVYLNMYPSAIKDFKNSQVNDFFFAPYETFLSYNASYNQNCNLSFYYDTYTFTGGAHGQTVRKAQTYNYKTRKELSLWNFFKNKAEARKIVIDEILKQAEQNLANNSGIYFEDYQTLIRKNFNPENFYLNNEGIVIFYNQYEIAPYSTGIVQFVIPYSMVDYPPKC